jgi:hypothetical protein
MTLNQAMTVGAIGFAVFAVYFVTRKNVNDSAATQPGQVQRDAGLSLWNDQLNGQAASIVDAAWGHYADELSRKLSA